MTSNHSSKSDHPISVADIITLGRMHLVHKMQDLSVITVKNAVSEKTIDQYQAIFARSVLFALKGKSYNTGISEHSSISEQAALQLL